MRKLIFVSMLAGALFTLHAQVPVAFKYQAVVRNLTGDILAEKSVSLRISLLSGGATGALVYSESHTGKTTNKFGLVDIEIGKGTPLAGTFTGINWSTGTFFIKVEMDSSGGTAFQEMGTSPLLSVPYALHAKTVETETDGDPGNEIQTILLNGNQLTLSKGGGTVTLPSSGGGDGWGTQTAVTDATLAGNGTVSSPLKIAQQSATTGQVLKWDGTSWKPSTDDTAPSGNPFVSSGGLTRNTNLSDNFVFGSSSLNDLTGTDDNIRMYFNKSKGAFRAGEAYESDWDEANAGEYSVALGYKTKATGKFSSALGSLNTAVGWYTTSMGYGTLANAINSVAIGKHNVGLGNPNVWTPEDPIFEIGIGSSQTSRSNAVTVLKNGNIGIGPVNPTAKLDIDGQVRIRQGNPGAGKVLTSDGSGLASWQTIAGGSFVLPFSGSASTDGYVFDITNSGPGNGISGKSSSGTALSGLATATVAANIGVAGQSNSSSGVGVWGNNIAAAGNGIAVRGSVQSATGYSGYFERGRFYVEGNAGIGTENPGAKLEVNGQVKITGGSPGTGKVLTSDALGLASWQTPGGGLTLPYSGSVSTTGDQAFSIWNTGTGNGIFTRASSGNGLVAQSNGGIKTSGVMGLAYGTGDNYGVTGGSNSASGTGVSGSATSLTGVTIGVSGMVISPDGYSGYFEGGKFYVSGNTGIGVTAPSAKLDINGQIKIRGGSPGSGKALISDANGLAGWQSIAPWLHNGTDIYLFNGNLGLGHTNPQARLDVSASQGPNIIIRDSDGGGGRPGIQFVNNDVHFIGSDDTSTEIFGFYSGYGSNRSNAARLNIHGPAFNNWGKYISLTYDGNHGRISTDAGYLVLEPSGQRVGIGTDAPTQNLDINGTARVRVMNTGTSAGTVYRTADGTLITGASDARLKENIKSIENSLDKVIRLNGVTYAWKSDPDKRQNIGFIAQDFEKVLPELVFTNSNDGYKGINYAEVTAVLVEAVKELKAENDRLKMENKSVVIELTQVTEKYKSLNSRLENIETLLKSHAGK